MNKPIVVVGSVNLDLVCTASRIPAPGETIWGDRFQMFHGGKGANQAVAASRLGANVRMIARVGDDEFGKQLRAGLTSASVNVDDVGISSGVASGVAMISVSTQGQNSITVVPGANNTLRPADLERCLPHLQSAGILLTQLEIPMETVEFLCFVAKKAQVPLMLDPAPAQALSPAMLSCVTYLTPNETEALTLCGMNQQQLGDEEALQAAEEMLAKGARNVILKMGDRGALLASAEGLRKMVPAIPVKVVDSTAAGDAFNGGVATGLMQGKTLEQAIEYGIAVSALSITRPGAQPAMPYAEEVLKFLQGLGTESSPSGPGSQRKPVEASVR